MAPSELHEWRRDELDAMLMLAGFRREISLGQGLIPDVARVSVERRRIAIGDAKATESPGDRATRSRLIRYVRMCDRLSAMGWASTFVLAVDPHDAADWARTVASAWRIGGMRPGWPASAVIAPGLEVLRIET